MMDLTLLQSVVDGTFQPRLTGEIVHDYILRNNTPVYVRPKFWLMSFLGFPPLPDIPPFSDLDCKTIRSWPGAAVGDAVMFFSATTGSLMNADVVRRPLGSRVSAGDQGLSADARTAFDAYERAHGLEISRLRYLPRLTQPWAADFDIGAGNSSRLANDGVSWLQLTRPNQIGRPPKPRDGMILPPDSLRILVGLGVREGLPGGWDVLLHEQYWMRSDSSFTLPPDADKEITIVHRSGRSETSSSLESVSKEIGASVSAGWGPVSASISASLSTSSQTSHSVTLTEESETVVRDDYKNPSKDQTEMILFWTLVDVYTWSAHATGALNTTASIEVRQSPPIADRTFLPSSQP